MAIEFAQENIWFDKWRYDDAECQYYEKQFGGSARLGTLANQIAKAREEIQSSLACGPRISPPTNTGSSNMQHQDIVNSITKLGGALTTLQKAVANLTDRVLALESASKKGSAPQAPAAKPTSRPAPQPPKPTEEEEDDDVDLFGSDDEEEDEAAAKVREERLKAYAEKKSKKPGPIAKSSVLLDCKPWDDETDMQKMEEVVRSIQMDGLNWGAAKLVPLAYGIKKLSILCIVEDEKVSIDDLIEKITEHEDFVQSVDIGAFNKI